jgi:arylsulfatase A-like enzyme
MFTHRQPPNIVFIVLDTQRSDRLGCYGYPRGTTPHLDAFAQKATVFENAIAPAQWTVPSHASMFTGEPPSTHMTLQSTDSLHPDFKTLAEHLEARGYRRTGICNNPLVGLINNNLKRGFDAFYNYCGTVQSRASDYARVSAHVRAPAPVRVLWRRSVSRVARQTLQGVVAPIQDAFGRYSQVFQAALNPLCVPLWTRFARFKGDTPRSIRDAARSVDQHVANSPRPGENGQPHFIFINLMEPHLPYSPPDRFVQAFAPYVREDGEAHSFMRSFNRQALHWITPTARPFSELQARTLSDMYDAEVAYQDHLLAELLSVLERPEHRDNTLVILVGDHGEMLGERQYVGHAFGVYRELVHVPLIVRWPGQREGKRLAPIVSATRLFHTVLEAAGAEVCETSYGHTMDIQGQSLRNETNRAGTPGRTVVSEAYAPEFALRALERHKPALIDPLGCRATHWAVYQGAHKLIHIQDTRDELYNVADDPMERNTLRVNGGDPDARRLRSGLKTFLEQAHAYRPNGHRLEGWSAPKVELKDELVQKRLRGLGYIE